MNKFICSSTLSLKVTSIRLCAMRYVSCNSCCCAVQPVTSTKQVTSLVLASVVEFRSTISEIDKSLDYSAPHGVWDGDGASTNRDLVPCWRSRHGGANQRLRTPAIIDFMSCPQPYSSTRRRVMLIPCLVQFLCSYVVSGRNIVVQQVYGWSQSEETRHI